MPMVCKRRRVTMQPPLRERVACVVFMPQWTQRLSTSIRNKKDSLARSLERWYHRCELQRPPLLWRVKRALANRGRDKVARSSNIASSSAIARPTPFLLDVVNADPRQTAVRCRCITRVRIPPLVASRSFIDGDFRVHAADPRSKIKGHRKVAAHIIPGVGVIRIQSIAGRPGARAVFANFFTLFFLDPRSLVCTCARPTTAKDSGFLLKTLFPLPFFFPVHYTVAAVAVHTYRTRALDPRRTRRTGRLHTRITYLHAYVTLRTYARVTPTPFLTLGSRI